jgi:glyoxylase-like metal-dependent hydrolase (beta-lactamase superfamily II)
VLKLVAKNVFVRGSDFVQSNAVVVQGDVGVLLIDPGVHAEEMTGLANDLTGLGETVSAGFSTHPHWDHLLWHTALGEAPRYGTGRCAATARARLSGDIAAIAKAVGIPNQVSLDLIGQITGLPEHATYVPWDGPRIRIIEHNAHAPGHAALLIEDRGVLVAGDMLSDLLVPTLDFRDASDPIEDYLVALGLLEAVAGDVDVVIPGHGSVGGADQLRSRIDQDRAYVEALRDGTDAHDPRVGASAGPGREWVTALHERQVQAVTQRG